MFQNYQIEIVNDCVIFEYVLVTRKQSPNCLEIAFHIQEQKFNKIQSSSYLSSKNNFKIWFTTKSKNKLFECILKIENDTKWLRNGKIDFVRHKFLTLRHDQNEISQMSWLLQKNNYQAEKVRRSHHYVFNYLRLDINNSSNEEIYWKSED